MDRAVGLFGLAAAVFLVGGIMTSSESSPAVVQPFPFNHQVHTAKVTCWECHFICEKNRDEDGELDCEDCEEAELAFCPEHLACPDHKLPGLPRVEDCLRCHEYDLLDLKENPASADEAAADTAKRVLFEYVEFDEYDEPSVIRQIPWQRITVLEKSAVYFSHRTHALVAEISCESCHGDTGSSTAPPQRPLVPMSMNWCLDCHAHEEATGDCASCHR